MALGSIFSGTTIKVETSLLPDFVIDVSAEGEPSLATKLLRPRITVYPPGSSSPLVTAQPAGDPNVGIPWGKLVLIGAVLAVAYWKLK